MQRMDHRGSYTISEAAEILQFHPDAVRYWVRVGELPGIEDRNNERWLIQPQDLVAFLKQNGEMLPSSLPVSR